MRSFLFFVLIVLWYTTLNAQKQKNVDFKIENFRTQVPALKHALQDIKDGDYYYAKGRRNITVALDYYIRANDFNPNNAALNYKIAKCYLRARPEKLALVFLAKYRDLSENVSIGYYLTLGRAYQRNLMFDEAEKAYKMFQALLSPTQAKKYRARLDMYMRECKIGREMVANPVRVFIDNLGASINSEYDDYWPVISVDESRLYFVSRRDASTGGLVDNSDEQYYEDIFYSDYQNGYWQPAMNMGKPVNSNGHDAIVGRSPDGQIILIYRNIGNNGGDIYYSKLNGSQWSKPKAFPKPINSSAHESSATFSYDGRRIYFVSNREGGYGGKDIYYCEKNKKGKWGKAINLGNSVNTKGDEIGVYMHADGKTLYFSSNGHVGMGNFDVYKTVYENGEWSDPINLGYPINTYDSDAFFTMAANGKHAYYATVREGSMGDMDIYLVTFLGQEKPLVDNTEDWLIAMRRSAITQNVIEKKVDINEHNLTLLKGVITDAKTHKPIEATIELIDVDKNIVLATFKSNSVTGAYVVSLPAGRNYGIAVKADNYLFHSENFNIGKEDGYDEELLNIALYRIEVGNKVRLNNIFFANREAVLSPSSQNELNRVLELMNDNPKIKIEVSGHTDNVGSRDYNLKLSTQRAKAVADYLISKGINTLRITYKGYGFDQPVADNNSETGRELNRRSEIKIIGD
ncbi:MAG: hypothetical protein DSY76_00345 [Bacteroidetes bacterium]|nr:MAG: hypothetical protein DSY76_00345 [Bacteroidota bacterium]